MAIGRLLKGISLAAAISAGTVAFAQPENANEEHAGVIKIDRIEVRPDGLRVSVDLLYPNAGLLHLVGAEAPSQGNGSADAFIEQLIQPLFDGVEGALRGESSAPQQPAGTLSPQTGTTLGEWRPNQRVRVSSSRSRVNAEGMSIDGGMDCSVGPNACQWAIGNDQLLELLGGIERSIETYRLSAQWASLPGVELGVDYFDTGYLGRHQSNRPAPLTPLESNNEQSVARGVDLNMAFGGDVGTLGQLAVSVKFRKLLESLPDDADLFDSGASSLMIDQQNDAAIGLNWQRGDFSGGVVSRYYDDLSHYADEEGKTWVTLDLQFTWQTPWKGSFELGARNLLGGEYPQDLSVNNDEQFEHLFGRIPYLQYRQSL